MQERPIFGVGVERRDGGSRAGKALLGERGAEKTKKGRRKNQKGRTKKPKRAGEKTKKGRPAATVGRWVFALAEDVRAHVRCTALRPFVRGSVPGCVLDVELYQQQALADEMVHGHSLFPLMNTGSRSRFA